MSLLGKRQSEEDEEGSNTKRSKANRPTSKHSESAFLAFDQAILVKSKDGTFKT